MEEQLMLAVRCRSRWSLAWSVEMLLLAGITSIHLPASSSAPSRSAAQTAAPIPALASQTRQSPASPFRELLVEYCVVCHNEKLRSGGLAFDTIDLAQAGAHADTLEKVVRKLRMGTMPPVGRRRPDAAAYDRFASWLESEIDRAAA